MPDSGSISRCVLGEEAREQHAVPVLVGALRGEPVDVLRARRSSRWSPSWRPCARKRLRSARCSRRRARPRLVVTHAQVLERLPRTGLGRASRLDHGRSRGLDADLGQRGHALRQLTSTGPSMTAESSRVRCRSSQASISACERSVARSIEIGLHLRLEQPRRLLERPLNPASDGVALRLHDRRADVASRCASSASSVPSSGLRGATSPTDCQDRLAISGQQLAPHAHSPRGVFSPCSNGFSNRLFSLAHGVTQQPRPALARRGATGSIGSSSNRPSVIAVHLRYWFRGLRQRRSRASPCAAR